MNLPSFPVLIESGIRKRWEFHKCETLEEDWGSEPLFEANARRGLAKILHASSCLAPAWSACNRPLVHLIWLYLVLLKETVLHLYL